MNGSYPYGEGTSQYDQGGEFQAVRLRVIKFGGTSLGSEQGLRAATAYIARQVAEGYGVVAVVSAPGRRGHPFATDTLLDQANGLGTYHRVAVLLQGEAHSALTLSGRLRAAGVSAVALSGPDAGICVEGPLDGARISRVETKPLQRWLEAGWVPVVAGFQGRSPSGIALLERGGSDASACALGAYLEAEAVDIMTDVPGIFTADPRVVPGAVPIVAISYDTAHLMARCGAKVVHPDAVQQAKAAGVPVYVRSTFEDAPGTRIDGALPGGPPVPVAVVTRQGANEVTVVGTPGCGPVLAPQVERALAERQVEMLSCAVSDASVTLRVAPDEAAGVACTLHTCLLEPSLASVGD